MYKIIAFDFDGTPVYSVDFYIPVSFHGTGDVFASTAVGALMRGYTLAEALRIAADYTFESIRLTMADPEHVNYGVQFEKAIPQLLKTLGDC